MEPTTFTARSPEDLVALAPLVLGFQPEESLVMLTFGDHAFHARIDLPASRADDHEVVGALLGPVLAHDLRRVVLLVFSARRPRTAMVRALLDAFASHDVEVVEMLQADGRRWFPLRADGRGAGTRYDVAGHPLAAQSVLQGQVVWSSRRALAASLDADPDRVARIADLLRPDTPLRAAQRPAEESWLRELLAGSGLGSRRLHDRDHARLLRLARDRVLWEAALLEQRRETAADQAALWTQAVRAAPPGWVAGPASQLGFAAWLGGQGALAWCAVDRCLAEQPDDERAHALADLLLNAVPPTRWAQVVADADRDLA